jgi:N,N'-diacetyllegionaminate synthase
MKPIDINGRSVDNGEPVYVIAEAHLDNVNNFQQLIDATKESGADAIAVHLEAGNFDSNFLMDVVMYAKEVGIDFIAIPSGENNIDVFEELEVSAYKVASADANNFTLLRRFAKTQKPIFLSTGMCTLFEVREAVETIENARGYNIVLLHSTASHDVLLTDVNLRAMVTLMGEFGFPVGYSDNSQEDCLSIAAIALGASVFTKRFSLDECTLKDNRSVLSKTGLKRLVDNIRKTEIFLGSTQKKIAQSEIGNREKYRKSITAKVEIPSGTILQSHMLGFRAPSNGLAPSFIDYLLGKKVIKDISRDEKINKDDIEWPVPK